MAQIISLQARARAPRRTAPAKGAQILFFTGVRYMRIEDYSPSQTDSRGDATAAAKNASVAPAPEQFDALIQS